MRARSRIPRLAVSALLVGSALIAAGCGEEAGYDTVGVTTPEFSSEGPILTMSQWRHRVGKVCREAMTEVNAVSTALAKDLEKQPGPRDAAAITQMAFEMSRPVVEEQLNHLAALRPPPEVAPEYRDFVTTLANELRWSGRIANMIGEEGSEDELLSADRSLAAAAAEVIAFVQEQRLRGCIPSLEGG
jgi:hypothetical protein